MRAGLVLGPFLTACLFVVIAMVINRQQRYRKHVGRVSLGLLLLFIPACAASAVGAVRLLDWMVTGEFRYSSASEMKNSSGYQIPPNAKEIVLCCRGFGHVARFRISPEEMAEWIKKMRAIKPELNSKSKESTADFADLALFEMDFPSKAFATAEWKYEPNMRCGHVQLAENGGGFSVWQAPDSQVTYLRAYYW